MWLKEEDAPYSADTIDKMVSAEIPEESNRRLFDIVTTNMIHGPCGKDNPSSICMDNKTCTKGFPKPFAEYTNTNVDGYPIYKRSKTEPFIVKTKNKRRQIDNSWVVPYNKWLLLKYNAHINIEIITSIKSVKYLFKYVHKGYSCANIEIHQKNSENRNDEVKSFLDARYICAPEAIWRIKEFRMSGISHAVIRLAVHLCEEQNVFYIEGEETEAIEAASSKETTLTAWFNLNRNYEIMRIEGEDPRNLLYVEIPFFYTFNKTTGSWQPRVQKRKTISRMYAVSASDVERFHLRLLLLHVRGAKSFEDIRTVDGVVCSTYKEAAIKLHLLADDEEWKNALDEAAIFKMPYQLRMLFAYICVFCNPQNARELWNKFKDHLVEDLVRLKLEDPESAAMRDIEDILRINGKCYKEYNLPKPSAFVQQFTYAAKEEKEKADRMIKQLTSQQMDIFKEIIEDTKRPKHSNCFFIDGPGGSGKTFLYNTIISTLRGENEVTIVVASTGIAANLLPGGRTYHSQFKLPLNLHESSVSQIRPNSDEAKVIKQSAIIIWDESTMASSYALEAIDRLLRDLMNNDKPFGGKVVILGGDFRQCLPVVKHGNRVDIVQSCIKCCRLWKHFKKNTLTNNIRCNDKEFSDWLIKLGNGELNDSEDNVEISNEFLTNSVIEFVFGTTMDKKSIDSYRNCAILCPKNDATFNINDQIINLFDGESMTYLSIDSIVTENEDDQLSYPIELLNSLTLSWMPPHKLTLKVGCIIMLLRNLNTRAGLCNGTRIVVKELRSNLIVGNILQGSGEGDSVFIPRIELISSTDDFPVAMKRRQFPVRIAFAMTINKSQGQTFDKVGLFIDTPVFSHGQLYVAFSRVKSKENVRIQMAKSENKSKAKSKIFNCVYKEIFDNLKLPLEFEYNSDYNMSKSVESNNSSHSTINYWYDELSSKATNALKLLIRLNAFSSMERLQHVWNLNNFDELFNVLISEVRAISDRRYAEEEIVSDYYYNAIRQEIPEILDDFVPVETESNGDCLYSAVSINLVGDGILTIPLRFATVGMILHYENQISANILNRCSEQKRKMNGYYNFTLIDLSFSAAVSCSFFDVAIHQIPFPQHLVHADLTVDSKMTFHWGCIFHQYMLSIVTDRPVHCYGIFGSEYYARRVLWRYESERKTPITFMHVCGNHYVGLLLKENKSWNDLYRFGQILLSLPNRRR